METQLKIKKKLSKKNYEKSHLNPLDSYEKIKIKTLNCIAKRKIKVIKLKIEEKSMSYLSYLISCKAICKEVIFISKYFSFFSQPCLSFFQSSQTLVKPLMV